jgi:hypothetical protein
MKLLSDPLPRGLLPRELLETARKSAPPGPPRPWKRWLAAVALGGYLLYCHGCHGDEDNELFALLNRCVAEPK